MAVPRLPLEQAFNVSDEEVTVEVGTGPTIFAVNVAVLGTSAFFRARMKPEWANDRAAIKLPDHSVRAFVLYFNWLYTRRLPSLLLSMDSNADHYVVFAKLAEAYALGEELIDTTFKDTVIDALRAKVRSASGFHLWPVGGEVVKAIYEATPAGSPARIFLAEVYASLACGSDLWDTENEAPKDFFFDVAVILKSHATVEKMTGFGGVSPVPYRYHCHEEGGSCYLEQD